MKTAYFDCFSGVSGDMCLGALIDAGMPLGYLERELKKLGIKGYSLRKRRVRRSGMAATKVDVVLQFPGRIGRGQPVTWAGIERIIDRSGLHEEMRRKGKAVFLKIFRAEAKVHGQPAGKVHLHELGGTDCLVDVFGTLIGLEYLGIKRIISSPVNTGSGSVNTGHGVIPVPAPAAAEMLRGVPVYASGDPCELTTPTGAALLTALAEDFGPMPLLVPDRIGIGAGARDIGGRPNILRIFIGEAAGRPVQGHIMVIESNIDDMNPQVYGHLMARLFREGALDVFLTQGIMKKSRPGVKLTVLCNDQDKDVLIQTIFRESTTIGLRYYAAERITMDREMRQVETVYGPVRVKCARLGKSASRCSPEYEDCRRLAERNHVPLLSVLEAAGRKAGKQLKKR